MAPTYLDTGCRMQDVRYSFLNSLPHPDSERRDTGAFDGVAWHPDSQRICVPGILSGSATTEGRLEARSALRETGHGARR